MQFLTNNEQICDAVVNTAMLLMCKETPTFNIQSTTLPASMFTFSPVQTIHIHHNGKGHYVTLSSLANKVKIFDSMNTKPTAEPLKQITAIYSSDSTNLKFWNLPTRQNGSVSCGLLATAYATDLAIGNNPAEIIYDRYEMRNHLQDCLKSSKVKPFPRFNRTGGEEQFIDITNNTEDTNK